jgi:hypothetical protein
MRALWTLCSMILAMRAIYLLYTNTGMHPCIYTIQGTACHYGIPYMGPWPILWGMVSSPCMHAYEGTHHTYTIHYGCMHTVILLHGLSQGIWCMLLYTCMRATGRAALRTSTRAVLYTTMGDILHESPLDPL